MMHCNDSQKGNSYLLCCGGAKRKIHLTMDCFALTTILTENELS